MAYKVHLDNNLDHWTGKSEKPTRREYFYYDETDLMAIRVDKLENAHWREVERDLVGSEDKSPAMSDAFLFGPFCLGQRGRNRWSRYVPIAPKVSTYR